MPITRCTAEKRRDWGSGARTGSGTDQRNEMPTWKSFSRSLVYCLFTTNMIT
jgi:hypothetical protein